jgi:hypothetical protein
MDKLILTFRQGIVEVWELADYFIVTEDMIRFRLSLPDILESSLGL